jgi:hypothetical protein
VYIAIFVCAAGFKSLVSIQNWPTVGAFGDYALPTSAEATAIAGEAGFRGLYTATDNNYLDEDVFNNFRTWMDNSPRPALVYDENAYKSVM